MLLVVTAIAFAVTVFLADDAFADVYEDHVNCHILQELFGVVETGFGPMTAYSRLDNNTTFSSTTGNCPRYRCTWLYFSSRPPAPRNIEWFGVANTSHALILHYQCDW